MTELPNKNISCPDILPLAHSSNVPDRSAMTKPGRLMHPDALKDRRYISGTRLQMQKNRTSHKKLSCSFHDLDNTEEGKLVNSMNQEAFQVTRKAKTIQQDRMRGLGVGDWGGRGGTGSPPLLSWCLLGCTGAYAVLLTLSQQSAEPGYPGYLTKAELCEADQSFTLASVRAEHYNAWSGVGTLLKHGLVTQWSNHAKFNITDKGLELARRIASVERGEDVGGESGKRRLELESGGQKRKARNESGQSGGEKEDTIKKSAIVQLSNNSHKIASLVDEHSDGVDYDLMLAIELSKKETPASASSQAMATGGAEAMKGLGCLQ